MHFYKRPCTWNAVIAQGCAGMVLFSLMGRMPAILFLFYQVVLSVKRIDTSSTTGALNLQAAARGERPYVPPPPSTEVPRSWREQLAQEVHA